ncbi:MULTISPECIES: hypothetical protein [unclassified Brevundimonas]|uniref:hypothetical protein n=1 Tax=unclassified Brevundimonas TaxID=2622653 RepID=UPI000701D732|nr:MULTISPECIES: hypothetical protein [unclassified Brevundimonas]KQY83775.1 hypothetical protein ASD25_24210 [Brevundimonas sp. Root1423]KRA19656.1 hypothetical protein ASD59_11660 [Brevundimonas sp. Root608]
MTDLYDDEILMRRVDGELSPDAGAAIDAAAAGDPALARRLERLRGLRTLAREAFPAAQDLRDGELARLILNGATRREPWTARLAGGLREGFAVRHAPVWAGAAAACFVLGLTVGWLGQDRTPEGFAVATDGVLADAALVRVLDRGLAADGADGEGRAVGLTFRDADGRWCRTFRAGDAGVAGLACRTEGDWRMQALAPFQASDSEVRTAGADTPAAVLAAVDALIADETLDAAAEAQARDAGWR